MTSLNQSGESKKAKGNSNNGSIRNVHLEIGNCDGMARLAWMVKGNA